jgi:hypothetical protein
LIENERRPNALGGAREMLRDADGRLKEAAEPTVPLDTAANEL